MDLLITHPDDADFLADEVRRTDPAARLDTVAPGVWALHRSEGRSREAGDTPGDRDVAEPTRPDAGLVVPCPEPPWVFARQVLPRATVASAPSISAWAELLHDAVRGLPMPEGTWRLHVWPRYGEGKAGQHRCELVVRALHERLGKHDRQRRRRLDAGTTAFRPEDSLVQLMLTAPDRGFLSVAPGPMPHLRRTQLAPFPAGEIPVAVDKEAPSRAFSKLVEAEARLGLSIREGERCVDLGASPGSWSYVALRRGASVTAVDRSPLRADLMSHPRLRFLAGDAFAFRPDAPVDWLICDVIAAPQRSMALARRWLTEGWCRNLIVTIKFKGSAEYAELDPLKHELPRLCSEYRLTRLCANRNEACVAGVAARPVSAAS